MAKSHHTNVLLLSCLKAPVDPQTKTPVALYERKRNANNNDNTNDEMQKMCDSDSDLGADDGQAKADTPLLLDPCEFSFSNLEYYHKLEQLRRAHLQTMAELDLMYRTKLDLYRQGMAPPSSSDRACGLQWDGPNLLPGSILRKFHSVHDLECGNPLLDMESEQIIDSNDRPGHVNPNTRNVLHQHIKNMWQNFSVNKPLSQNHPGDSRNRKQPKAQVQRQKKERRPQEKGWRSQITVPKPFQMTLREAELKSKRIRSRSEIERENEELRKQLEELTKCQRKFRASSVPAHVHLPLYEELQERNEERRRQVRAVEQQRLLQRPFSFLKREEDKKEQKVALKQEEKEQEKPKRIRFHAKPVPRAVKEAALGEQQKEEQLYREIKKQMRATEMLLGASMPPSMLAKRLAERRLRKAVQMADDSKHQLTINTQVPDFDASYRRFKKQLENKRGFRPVTACEPFTLSTANNTTHEKCVKDEQRSPRISRRQFATSSPQTSSSSACSSFSGSLENVPSKITDAVKKRQEAVRKVLEQRKTAKQEEETWKKQQRQRERKLQKLIARRAQANDPHVALAETCQSKLEEFRMQDLQRRKEYREELREIQERVKSRPLLLERVAQMNAKQVAERCYAEALRERGLCVSFVNSKAPTNLKLGRTSSSNCSDTLFSSRPGKTQKIELDTDDLDLEDLRPGVLVHLDDQDVNDQTETGTQVLLLDIYPPDYDDYEQDTEDESVEGENESQKEKNQKLNHKSDPDNEFDGCLYDSDLNSDDNEDKSDHSNTSGLSDNKQSPLRNESRHSNEAFSSKEELRGREEKDEEN